ncbi:nickel ABC transporter membrane protein NikMN [Desulfuromonas sp. DDH964]|uniref:energy-coupling factor ABC transporter permease n=1 Tax=Desulfuromonas sp. DDH964 TaxID=1823759 RepID=UPI00078B9464|nr:energy-coupling factor ABC transporter permease [Desulfuromonas sp. DDH964]AMV73810.1 nickel ABC transporter membrane protein NikMN [Desulfuromonas sp. DDH964]
MHMADALLSPAVGGTLWAATSGTIAYCSRKVKQDLDDRKVPLMGVLGAFIFAAQMINFTIPATGSSGHLGGGMILAILLGPYAAFLTMASVLTVQAFFFADGGLLALGCNIFNLGFFPCFVAYPLIYKKIVGDNPGEKRILLGAVVAALVGLQLGALNVVLETVASGISSLPFTTFVLLMQPVHLAIGLVEGLVTATVVLFVWKSRPEILELTAEARPFGTLPIRKVLVGLLATAVVTGGALSWFASAHPDGLEWAIQGVTGREELDAPEHGVHGWLAGLQESLAFLPDYGFRTTSAGPEPEVATTGAEAWPAVDAGTSLSGLVGGVLTLALAAIVGLVLKRRAQPGRSRERTSN